MARADHICVERPNYWHHGIDMGDGTVIHYSGSKDNKEYAVVARTLMKEFLDGGHAVVVYYYDAVIPIDETIGRAIRTIGKGGYDLFTSNCEHFARWCKTGRAESKQVDDRKSDTAVHAGLWAAACTALAIGASPAIAIAALPVAVLFTTGVAVGKINPIHQVSDPKQMVELVQTIPTRTEARSILELAAAHRLSLKS
jgi:Lecithin retinol acyltransferase